MSTAGELNAITKSSKEFKFGPVGRFQSLNPNRFHDHTDSAVASVIGSSKILDPRTYCPFANSAENNHGHRHVSLDEVTTRWFP